MELSFNDLKKRCVINVRDGKNMGNISDLVLKFPEGSLQGIVVPLDKGNFFTRLFSKQTVYIPEKQILKIGGDVIFVDLRCGDFCENGVVGVGKKTRHKPQQPSNCSVCPPSCPPQPRNQGNPLNEDNIFNAVMNVDDYDEY